MYRIQFVNQNKVHETEGGLLSQICADAGFPLNLVCGGRGTCGKCRVRVERGGETESVLACSTRVDRDMAVYLTEAQCAPAAAIMTAGRSARQAALSPAVRKRCFTRKELQPGHCGAYLQSGGLAFLQRFSRLLADPAAERVTLIYFHDEPVWAEPGDTTGRLYGGAVDIGTTSVVLYACDLNSGALLHTASALNGQIARGADVISRILHVQQEPGGLEELRGQVLETVNSLLRQAGERIPGFLEHLYQLTLCGNSTMQHLFFGMDPSGLSADPFVNVTDGIIRATGAETGLEMAPAGTVEFLPLLGGFVGADTTAVLLTLPEEAKRCLMVDLGTNGEIAVGGAGEFRVASTACGPALEGGNIACGMRGTQGAIEKIAIDGDRVTLQVIGGGQPQGLCGSAIIDAVAELLRAGIIDDTGRLLPAEEFAPDHPGSALTERLGMLDEYNTAFFFTRGDHPVYLSQRDVRQIQLAKSSIYSGCLTLLAEAGLTPGDVSALYLAGAFGNYIDIDNALYMGLLPPVPRERIVSVGNGAGQGVQLCLLNRRELDRCQALHDRAEHVELAASPGFMEEYVTNMNFLTDEVCI